jgi:hypothetical protein
MSLFDRLKNDGNLSLKGNLGPEFENEGQRSSSNIQALAKNNQLVSSQSMVLGRTYGGVPFRVRVNPSRLDINGTTPSQYRNKIGEFGLNPGVISPLEKRLPFGKLGNGGQPLPTFENENQRNTSDIHAFSTSNQLKKSQDLLTGRRYGTGRFTVFVPPSDPPVSFPNQFVGKPYYPSLGGPYKNKGPREGRY